MCLDARLLPHKLVNMNMNQNDKVFQNSELNFQREKEHVWGPHVSDTIFFFWGWGPTPLLLHKSFSPKSFGSTLKVCVVVVDG